MGYNNLINQVPAVNNVLLVTTVTPPKLAAGANLVVAVTTSTYRTPVRVTSALASVSNAFTTLKDQTVACARADITVMLPVATVEVSISLQFDSYIQLDDKNMTLFYHPECTCNFLGTERSQCQSRDECVCQRATGQCQCLSHVIGQTCDHCAPNYWNLASGQGCEPCGCDPNNAYTSGCNEVMLLT